MSPVERDQFLEDEIHDFDDTVVAILANEPSVDDVLRDLSASGYEVEVLRGEEGKAHLDPAGASGPTATIKRLLNAFGDQYRVLDRLNEALDEGMLVISVDSKPDEATEAIEILQNHGGEFIWKLGAWTYTQIAE